MITVASRAHRTLKKTQNFTTSPQDIKNIDILSMKFGHLEDMIGFYHDGNGHAIFSINPSGVFIFKDEIFIFFKDVIHTYLDGETFESVTGINIYNGKNHFILISGKKGPYPDWSQVARFFMKCIKDAKTAGAEI